MLYRKNRVFYRQERVLLCALAPDFSIGQQRSSLRRLSLSKAMSAQSEHTVIKCSVNICVMEGNQRPQSLGIV